MGNALTGGFDAVLEVRRKTVRRFLAAMHEHGGDSLVDDLPRLPHNMVFRIGDDGAIGGVRGKVQAQLGVPRIELVAGAEVGPAAAGKVVAVCPVRAWFRPDPGTIPLPPFICGDLHATFRVTLEAQPAGAALRFTPSDDPAETAFESAGLSAGEKGQVAQQARHYLQSWSAEQPFVVVLGALDFPLRARNVGDVIAVPLPLPGGQPPPPSLAGVSQDFTATTSGPTDFAVAVSTDYVLGLLQPFLDQVKASHPTFTVSPPWPLPDSTYTVHVTKAAASWTAAGSSATIKLSFEGDATTPTILPNADWDVSLAFVLSFDSAAHALVLTAAGDPTVAVDVHGPAGGLVEGKAENNVKEEVKKKRDAALPDLQAKVAAALPAQIARLKGLLQQVVAYATVSVKWAHFGPDGVVLGGVVGMLSRKKAPQVTISVLPDGSGYTAFSNWLPGGWISGYRWLWASWGVDPVTGEPTLKPEPGPVPGTHVWPHEEKTFGDRFVLQQGNGVDLPGLDGGGPSNEDSKFWQLCLYVSGFQIDPKTGDEATYPLDPWGLGLQPAEATELIASIQDSEVHPGSCGIGETGKPIWYAWRKPIRWMQPDPALEVAGVWVKCTWLDPDPHPGGGTYVGHLDLLAHSELGSPMGGRSTAVQFLAEGSPVPTLRLLGDALRLAGAAADGVAVLLVLQEGRVDRLGVEAANAVRAFDRDFPGVRVLLLEDIRGSWSRVLEVPTESAARGAIRVVDAAGRLAFRGDGPFAAEALSRALGELPVRAALPRAQPLIPVFGAGVPPEDLLVETVPGRPITLRHLHGRPLVLGFARPWSVPCRAVLHELAAAYQHLARGGVTVLGILTGADADRAAAFRADQGLPFPIVADPAAAIARGCEIRLWPTTLWMDGDRQVRFRAGASSAAMAAWVRERPVTAAGVSLSPQTG